MLFLLERKSFTTKIFLTLRHLSTPKTSKVATICPYLNHIAHSRNLSWIMEKIAQFLCITRVIESLYTIVAKSRVIMTSIKALMITVKGITTTM